MNSIPILSGLLFVFGMSTATVSGLEFRVVSWSGTVSNLTLSQGPGSEEFPLRVHEDTLSPVYRLKGEGPLQLHRLTPVADAPDVKTLVATLPLPEKTDRAILVLAPARSNGSAYTGLWLDDSPDARPANSIALHNLAGRTLALKLGATQTLLPPQGAHMQPFNERDRSVLIQAAVQNGENWTRVISSPQPVKPGFRILILLREGRPLPDGSISPIDRLTFYDYSAPPASS